MYKSVYFDGDVQKFVEQIAAETTSGNDVMIYLYGYRAIAFAGSSKESIKRDILIKLKVIKARKSNEHLLLNFGSSISDEFCKHLNEATPEEIADLCLEEGIIGSKSL